MAIPFIEEILKENSIDDILITIFSPSGYSQAIKGPYAERVMYLPLDTAGQVKQFYKDYSPSKFVLIRYDFWYNLISQGLKNGTQFHLVN